MTSLHIKTFCPALSALKIRGKKERKGAVDWKQPKMKEPHS